MGSGCYDASLFYQAVKSAKHVFDQGVSSSAKFLFPFPANAHLLLSSYIHFRPINLNRSRFIPHPHFGFWDNQNYQKGHQHFLTTPENVGKCPIEPIFHFQREVGYEFTLLDIGGGFPGHPQAGITFEDVSCLTCNIYCYHPTSFHDTKLLYNSMVATTLHF